jgi:hypothetical protein
MATTTSGRGKRRILTPEEARNEEEETLNRYGNLPGRLPADWAARSEVPCEKEISLDHATETEWDEFLDSLDEGDE